MSCDAAGVVRKKKAQKPLQKLCWQREEVDNSWLDSKVVIAQWSKEERQLLHGIRVWPGYSQPISPKLWFPSFPRCKTPSKGYSATLQNIKPFQNAVFASYVNREATKGLQKASPGWDKAVGVSYGGQAKFVGKSL